MLLIKFYDIQNGLILYEPRHPLPVLCLVGWWINIAKHKTVTVVGDHHQQLEF